jgi:hypothetical protein
MILLLSIDIDSTGSGRVWEGVAAKHGIEAQK